MKRFFAAALLAISFHVLLFLSTAGWLKGKPLNTSPSKTLTLTLTYLKPMKEKSEPAVKTPEPPSNRHVPVFEKRKIEVKPQAEKPKTEKTQKMRVKEKPKTETPNEKVSKKKEHVKKEKKPLRHDLSEPLLTPLSPSSDDSLYFQVAAIDEIQEEVHVETSPSPGPEEAIPQGKTGGDFPDFDAAAMEAAVHASEASAQASLPVVERIVEAMPLYKVNPTPKYPRLARRRGYKGTVVLKVLVNSNGKVGEIEVEKSSGYAVLDRSALSAVKDWLFEPARKGNRQVGMWVRVPVRFELK